MYIILHILLFILFILFICKISNNETYTNINYETQKLPYKVKDDVYMSFLDELNNSFKKHLEDFNKNNISPIRQKVLCDDHIRKEVESKALIDAFKKVPEKNIQKDSVLFNINIPSNIDFTINDKRECANKASYLCDITEPMLYISQNTNFPPRWIFKPYSDVDLPKHMDLKCWSNMLNCCKNNID